MRSIVIRYGFFIAKYRKICFEDSFFTKLPTNASRRKNLFPRVNINISVIALAKERLFSLAFSWKSLRKFGASYTEHANASKFVPRYWRKKYALLRNSDCFPEHEKRKHGDLLELLLLLFQPLSGKIHFHSLLSKTWFRAVAYYLRMFSLSLSLSFVTRLLISVIK